MTDPDKPWLKDPIIGKAMPKRRWWHGWLIPFAEKPGGCGGGWFYRWLFLLWMGWPMPLRIRIAPTRRLFVKAMPSCGCLVWAKESVGYFHYWRRYTFSAT